MCLIGVGMLFFTPKLVKIIKGIVPEKPRGENNGNWYWVESFYNKGSYHQSGEGFIYFLGCAVSTSIYVIVALRMINLTWLQIIVAPRVWLVEYMSKMVS